MKFSMNGALTIGTLDGANVEIREEVGAENFFLFGLTVREVAALRAAGYRPCDLYRRIRDLRAVIDALRAGVFSPAEPELFPPLVDILLQHDPYIALADFAAYVDCQQRVDRGLPRTRGLDAHVDPEHRALGQVLLRPHHPRVRRDIWKVEARPIRLLTPAEVKAGFLQ